MNLALGSGVSYHDSFVIIKENIVDLSGMISIEHAESLLEAELEGAKPEDEVILIALKKRF